MTRPPALRAPSEAAFMRPVPPPVSRIWPLRAMASPQEKRVFTGIRFFSVAPHHPYDHWFSWNGNHLGHSVSFPPPLHPLPRGEGNSFSRSYSFTHRWKAFPDDWLHAAPFSRTSGR